MKRISESRKSTPLSTPNSTKSVRTKKSNSQLKANEDMQSPEQVTFENIMNDPGKRDILLKFLAMEKENINRYKHEQQKKAGKVNSNRKNTLKKTHCESPTALHRRRALEKQNFPSNSSLNPELVSDSNSATAVPVPFNEILENVVIYVEVMYKGSDRSSGLKTLLAAMGATVVDSLTKDVTHVLFKGGSFLTYQKAMLRKIHAVSLLWLDAVKTKQMRVPEKNYPALGTDPYDVDVTLLCEDYDEMIEDEYRRSLAVRDENAILNEINPPPTTKLFHNVENNFRRKSSSNDSMLLPSQDCEVWRSISYRNNPVPTYSVPKHKQIDDDRLEDLTSDDDSDCPVVDGDSQTKSRRVFLPDLSVHDIESLLVKDTNKYADNLDEISMDLTMNASKHKNIGPRKSSRFIRNKYTILPELSSEEELVEFNNEKVGPKSSTPTKTVENEVAETVVNVNGLEKPEEVRQKTPARLSNGKQSLLSNGSSTPSFIEVKRDSVSNDCVIITSRANGNSRSKSFVDTAGNKLSPSTNNSELPTKKKQNDSLISEEMPSLRVSSSSSTRRTSTRKSSMNGIVTSKTSFSSESMPTLRISSSASEPRDSTKRSSLIKQSGDVPNAIPESRTFSSESMPALRISSNTNESNSRKDSPSKRQLEDALDKTKAGVLDALVRNRRRRGSSLNIPSDVDESRDSSNNPPHEDALRDQSKEKSAEKGDDEIGNHEKSNTINDSSRDDTFQSCECSPVDPTIIYDLIDALEDQEFNEKEVNENSTKPNQKTKLRKLYNLNASIDENVMNLNEDEKENRDKIAEPKTNSTNKVLVIPLTPIIFTHNAKKMLENKQKRNGKNKTKRNVLKEVIQPSTAKPHLNQSPQIAKKRPLNEDKQVNKAKKRTRTPSPDTDESMSVSMSSSKLSKSVSIRKSTRLSQLPQRCYRENSSNSSDNEIPIKPQLNRRSTFDFITSPTKHRLTQKPKRTRTSVVCTRFHRAQMLTLINGIKELSGYVIEQTVSKRTSHLVVGELARTLNLMRAITRGCWILKYEWLTRSIKAGKWLPEEDFELTNFSPSVQQCRMQREAFGSLYSMDIFENCGPIYVGRNSEPKRSDLTELIELCKGKTTGSIHNASISIGERIWYKKVICVSEKWVLDSITYNKRKSFKKYLLRNNNDYVIN